MEESAFGCEKEISSLARKNVQLVMVKGSKNPEDVHTCNTCKGAGQVRFAQGFSLFNSHAQKCHGRGKTIKILVVIVVVVAWLKKTVK